jgi:beta-lactamase regulating signal transducer with metallopeptidase domain
MEWTLAQVNSIGQAFVSLAGRLLIESAALIGLVLLVEMALRRSVRAALRCWLVALVLIYLFLAPLLALSPPSPRWPAGNAAYADTTTITAARHTNAPLPQPATGQSQTTKVGVGERPRFLTWQGAVFLVWLAGLLASGRVLVRRTALAYRGAEASPEANYLMADILSYCRKRMGVKDQVRLRISEQGSRPMVCGLLRPVILVPRDLVPALGSRHLRDVLFHELAHVKRGDAWMNAAQNLIQVLYFYNPLLWVAHATIRPLRDDAADETVRDTVGDKDFSYARRLVEVAHLSRNRLSPNLGLIGVA